MSTMRYFGLINTDALPHAQANQASITTGLGILFAITGSIALLVIVIAGFRYILAQGDPNEVARARNTILYALVGLAISLAAFSIVTLVINGT